MSICCKGALLLRSPHLLELGLPRKDDELLLLIRICISTPLAPHYADHTLPVRVIGARSIQAEGAFSFDGGDLVGAVAEGMRGAAASLEGYERGG